MAYGDKLKIGHVLHTEHEKKIDVKRCIMPIQTSIPKTNTITQSIRAIDANKKIGHVLHTEYEKKNYASAVRNVNINTPTKNEGNRSKRLGSIGHSVNLHPL